MSLQDGCVWDVPSRPLHARQCGRDPVGNWPIPICAAHLRELHDRVQRRLAMEAAERAVYAEEARLRDQRERDEKRCVYFVQRADGSVKIGQTCFPLDRARALSAEHGPLRLLGMRRAGVRAEHDLHRQFAHLRVEGEWFRPDPELTAYAGKCRHVLSADVRELLARLDHEAAHSRGPA